MWFLGWLDFAVASAGSLKLEHRDRYETMRYGYSLGGDESVLRAFLAF